MRFNSRLLTIALAAVLAVIAADAAMARQKKHSTRHHSGSGDLVVKRDYDGTPIIMQGYSARPAIRRDQYADRPGAVFIPRGSSSYVDIPPPVPSPYSANSPPAAALTQPTVQPYNPPPITTFSDRVTGAIHAYPLQGGIGNNPADQQSFIRQRANQ